MGIVTREELDPIVKTGRSQRLEGEALEAFVRERLLEEHPTLVVEAVVRNGHVYNVLDYLMLDLDSYG